MEREIMIQFKPCLSLSLKLAKATFSAMKQMSCLKVG